MKILKNFIAVITVFVLVACGGGGGGGGTGGGTPLPTAPVAIDGDNIGKIASYALGMNGGDFLHDNPIIAGVATSSSQEQNFNLFDRINTLPSRVTDISQPGTPMIVGVIDTSFPLTCQDGGSGVWYVYHQDDTLTILTADDYWTFSYTNCNNSGIIVNGEETYEWTANGDPNAIPPWEWKMRVTYSNLKVTSGSEYVLFDGMLNATLGQKSSNDEYVYLESGVGDKLYLEDQTNKTELTNFSLKRDQVYSSGIVTYDSNFTVASTVIGGSITVVTTTPFVYTSPNVWPDSGIMTITGADGSTVTLTTVDSSSVIIDYTLADGSSGTSGVIPWGSLASYTVTP